MDFKTHQKFCQINRPGWLVTFLHFYEFWAFRKKTFFSNSVFSRLLKKPSGETARFSSTLRSGDFKDTHGTGFGALAAGYALLGDVHDGVFHHEAKRAGFTALAAVVAHLEVHDAHSKLIAAYGLLRTGICTASALYTCHRSCYETLYAALVANSFPLPHLQECK